MRTSGSIYIGYGDSRYFRIRTRSPRNGCTKFLSMIDFNILDIKGTFKRKGSEAGDWQDGAFSYLKIQYHKKLYRIER